MKFSSDRGERMSRTVADVRHVFGLIGDARAYRTGEGQGGVSA